MIPVVERSRWSLFVSVLVHTGVLLPWALHATAPAGRGPARDVWAGAGLEWVELGELAPGREAAPPLAEAPAAAVDPPSAPDTEPVPSPPVADPLREPTTQPQAADEERAAAESEDDWMSLDHQIEPDEEPAPVQPPQPDSAEQARRRLLDRTLAFRPRVGVLGDAGVSGAPTDAGWGAGAAGSPDAALASARPGMGAPGGEAAEAGPRPLPKAFTRAIPAASSGDAAWQRLPLGRAGKAKVALTIDADGVITRTDVHRPVPQHLERLIDRTVLALRGGHFVLVGASEGAQTLLLEASISRRRVTAAPLQLGYDAPRPEHAGRAYFQLASGRFVEVEVSIQGP